MTTQQIWRIYNKHRDFTFEDLCLTDLLLAGEFNKDSPEMKQLMADGVIIGIKGNKALLCAKVSKLFNMARDYEELAKKLIALYPKISYNETGAWSNTTPLKSVVTKLKKMIAEIDEGIDASDEVIIEATKKYLRSKCKDGKYMYLHTLGNFIYNEKNGSTLQVLLMPDTAANNKTSYSDLE